MGVLVGHDLHQTSRHLLSRSIAEAGPDGYVRGLKKPRDG
jgi:hypothetical protein